MFQIPKICLSCIDLERENWRKLQMFWPCLMRKLEMFRMFCPEKLSLTSDFKSRSADINQFF